MDEPDLSICSTIEIERVCGWRHDSCSQIFHREILTFKCILNYWQQQCRLWGWIPLGRLEGLWFNRFSSHEKIYLKRKARRNHTDRSNYQEKSTSLSVRKLNVEKQKNDEGIHAALLIKDNLWEEKTPQNWHKLTIKGSIEPTHGSACNDVRKLQSMDVLKLSNSLSFWTWSTYPGDKENLSNFWFTWIHTVKL